MTKIIEELKSLFKTLDLIDEKVEEGKDCDYLQESIVCHHIKLRELVEGLEN